MCAHEAVCVHTYVHVYVGRTGDLHALKALWRVPTYVCAHVRGNKTFLH